MRTRSPHPDPSSVTDTVEKTVLPSGLRIVTEHVPCVQSLALGVWVNVGSRDEKAGENGISHFIEHAVFKGTRTRRTHHIAQYLEAVGGYLNAFTTKDATCYYARVMAPHLPRAAHLLADIVLRPSFPEKEMEREKQVILEEMRAIEDDPEDLIHDRFERALFGRHGLGQPIIGKPGNVRSYSVEQLRSFVRSHYTAGNMVIAASGNVDHRALVELCVREFEDLPSGEPQRRTPPRPRLRQNDSVTRQISQAHVILGHRVSGLRSTERTSLTLLNTVLGDGMSSRLFQRLRERYGYAYNVYSFLTQYDDVGVFGVYAGMEQSNATKVREQIERVLDDLRERGVSARELNRAREQAIGSMILGLESMSTRMSRIGKDELTFGHDIPVRSVIRQLEQVDSGCIQALARKYLRTDRLLSTVFIPQNT